MNPESNPEKIKEQVEKDIVEKKMKQLPPEAKEMINSMIGDFGDMIGNSDHSIKILEEKEEIRNAQMEWMKRKIVEIDQNVKVMMNQLNNIYKKVK